MKILSLKFSIPNSCEPWRNVCLIDGTEQPLQLVDGERFSAAKSCAEHHDGDEPTVLCLVGA